MNEVGIAMVDIADATSTLAKRVAAQDLAKPYQYASPFPHAIFVDALPENVARALQEEILSLPTNAFDRYDNPFEQKDTLRDKYAYPPNLAALMDAWTSPTFVDALSRLVGAPLHTDPDRNFWGVHVFRDGDKLDIHLDAGQHPHGHGKKWTTIGLYLSKNWEECYGGSLEMWRGDATTLHACERAYAPLFNRMFVFTNNAVSWHGSPDPVQCPPDARRILVTLSYLTSFAGNEAAELRKKALFAPRPGEVDDDEKAELRRRRADPTLCHQVYAAFNTHHATTL